MSKFLKFCGLITLICFSFFYTEKVMMVVSERDPLKMKIINTMDLYKIDAYEAIINEDTIIPGINGRVVNVQKSYNKMKKNNVFNDNYLVYDSIFPKDRLEDNLDKYIISGNKINNKISIVFIIYNSNNLDKIINILDNKLVIANLFVDYNYLYKNINDIKKYINHNIYSYQDKYTYDSLVISNNIIKRVANNNPSLCFVDVKDNDNLNVCSYSKMNTIIPSVNGTLFDIKNKLENGSIILVDTGINTVNELSYIIDFIVGKGYEIVGLDELLSENI